MKLQSDLLNIRLPHLLKFHLPKSLYAQSYAIEVYAKTISEINRKNKTIDILIGSNGFMQCTAKWAAYRNTGNLGTPPVSQGDSCLAPVPADYQPGG